MSQHNSQLAGFIEEESESHCRNNGFCTKDKDEEIQKLQNLLSRMEQRLAFVEKHLY